MRPADQTVTVGGQDVTLTCPTSFALRTEVWLLSAENRTRGLAAALGMCWLRPRRPKVSYQACQFSPARYGAAVLDELMERGIPLTDILRAGGVALEMMVDSLPTESMVKEAEGNSEGPEGPSTE